MKTKILALTFAAVAAIGAAVAVSSPRIRFTVHVVGEDGQPVAGVSASLIFHPKEAEVENYVKIDVVSDDQGNK